MLLGMRLGGGHRAAAASYPDRLRQGIRGISGCPKAAGMSNATSRRSPVLLLDVMDTIVYDPFFKDMPRHFGITFEELLKAKHPTAWVEFECSRISEEELAATFFADKRYVDIQALRAMMRSSYRYLDGMEQLLGRLKAAGYQMHAFSNYPCWHQIIEDKLRLSRFLSWTYLSCEGPMQGTRKPAQAAYERVLAHAACDPSSLLFVDDRPVNIQGAQAAGIPSLLFKGAQDLEQQLRSQGLEF